MNPTRGTKSVFISIVLSALAVGCGGGSGSSGSSGSSGTTPSGPTVSSISVSATATSVTIGDTMQLTAAVVGTGNFDNSVSWSISGPSGWTGSVGSISKTGLYETPYPAPATVTITATSVADPSISGSDKLTIVSPAVAAGPPLTVDASDKLHAISPDIYGMNAFMLDPKTAQETNATVIRWGGNNTSRYNYKLNTTNADADYYFENDSGVADMMPNPTGSSSLSQLIATDDSLGVTTLATMPMLGWVSNDKIGACSFPASTYPGQVSYNGSCGNGVYPDGTQGCTNSNGCNIFGDASTPAITSIADPPPATTQAALPTPSQATTAWAESTWAGGWVESILKADGPANPASGTGQGVSIWDLDNEPAWWDLNHRDVHPKPSTYDEVTFGGISTALAIKKVDPTALVSGPIIDYWWNYFYSKKDIESGWSSGPCYQPWSNPVDREAHGGVAMIPYYLQQFRAAQATYGIRLLDYLDIHAYVANDASGNSLGLTDAGDAAEQQARLNSTRALWDPTYTNKDFPQPNYVTDSNYTSSCNVPLEAPQIVTRLNNWVTNNYPGTKTAIDEYNFGGLESINGALTQADVLGIFGQYGLDLATLWPTNQYTTQVPGNMAFEIYRNYDGSKSTFGDEALASCSGGTAGSCTPGGTDESGQGQLSVYGAARTSDGAITVVVVNKTFGDLTSSLSLDHVTATGKAQVYQYSAADLTKIVPETDVAVTPPASGSTTSTIAYTFPASSITLFVIPTQ